jgi:hypothetical protein
MAEKQKSNKELAKLRRLDTRWSDLKGIRSNWEIAWEELRHYVRPDVMSFIGDQTRGQERHYRRFDGTAPWALEQLASGLNSFLTSPNDQWFTLSVFGKPMNELTNPQKKWLQDVANIIYQEYSETEVGWNSATHENYLDLGTFGTSVLFQGEVARKNRLTFRPYELSTCYLDEDEDGLIDVNYRIDMLSKRQIMQRWPKSVPEAVMKDESTTKKWKVVHAVEPRDDLGSLGKGRGSINKPYSSIYWMPECNEILDEGGYDEFPYAIPRWGKLTGETYGRGPGMTCIQDVRTVNTMVREILIAAQLANRPPILVPDDGYMLPIRTAPSSLIYYTPGADELKPIDFSGRVELALDVINEHRDTINKCFHVDWIIRGKKKERQTAFEIDDDRNEMLRQLTPVLGRIQNELLEKSISRSYNLLSNMGRIPESPFEEDVVFEINYTSPAATAQRGVKGNVARRYLQDLLQLAQIKPEVLDEVNMTRTARYIADLDNVPREILSTDEELAAIQQQRAAEAQQAAQAQQVVDAQGAASANLDLAKAEEIAGATL